MSDTKQQQSEQQQPSKKKRRQQLWRDIIPTPAHYHVSFMHRDIITHAISSQKHGYVVTASQDGVVKFWKRITIDDSDADDATKDAGSSENKKAVEAVTSQCLEFVKSFTAHVGPVVNLQVSHEGDTVVSVGVDRVVKVYDVSTFDVTGMIKIASEEDSSDGKIGPAVLFAQGCLALAIEETIHVYALDTLSLLKTIAVHAAPITAMVYNPKFKCVLSTDRKGMMEFWRAQHNDSLGSGASIDGVTYSSKSDDTDLYTLFQKKTFGLALATSGSHYALYGANGLVYIFEHTTGKLMVRFDERLKVYDATFQEQYQMDALEYGKRAATEREMQQESPIFGATNYGNDDSLHQSLTITFDATGNFLLVPTLVGIKVFDWARRKVVKIVGKEDANAIRMIGVCLCEGDAKVNQQMQLARTGGSKTAMNHDAIKLSDALIISMSYQKRRFYVFSHKDPWLQQQQEQEDGGDAGVIITRDVLNEPPTAEDRLLADNGSSSANNAASNLGSEAILRTTMGDIHMKLFCKEVPRTIENFCTHARNGYYNDVIFHRVIPSFMLQTGDPLGDGTGGESVWGGEFEDEFVRELRHDRPFTVSMANAGPNTNGSQFFITVCPTPWLDQKHTVFGRITKGMDICTAIEKVETDHNDKPLKEISILSIDID